MLGIIAVNAQNWQPDTDRFGATYCYRELNGKDHDALTTNGVMTSMPTDNNMVLAYYWRIPKGKVRANIVWTNAYARFAKMHIRVIRPTTGDTLAENDLANSNFKSEQHTDDLFGTIDFPADEFYRVEISSPKWSYIKQIARFEFQRESTSPVMIPRNFGGTSGHMWNWSSTDPDAPQGHAYDWAYIEARVPYEYSFPGTYYMTIGALNGYMGMQTVDPAGAPGDFNRSVLFSVWDNGNMDEDPNLPDYMQSGVMMGNPDAVHTHAGGEGSSASVMLKGSTKWWRPDKWVQFLQNTRPETITIFGKTKDGRDTTFIYENTICTAFYKMDDEPTWRYLGTIRSSGINSLMNGWYSFIEPFTTYAGQMKHRALYRHPAMRSANSGRWYSRNHVDFWDEKYDRDFHYDYGRGASQEYDNCFFFEMGGYGLQTDSAKTTNLAEDMSFVNNINLDSLNNIIDHAVSYDQTILFNSRINLTADNIDQSKWSVITSQTSNGASASRAIDDDENSGWICGSGYPYTLALKSDEEQTVTSFNIYWEYKYDYRCLYASLATSDDGNTWTTLFDSLEIRTGIDRPDISLPQPVKTKYLKLTFFKPFTTNNFMLSEIRFRGDYNSEALLKLAKTELDDANTLNHYPAKDLKLVRTAYNKGNPVSITALAMALKGVAVNGTFYKYSRVSDTKHINNQRTYILENISGNGTLCATPDGRLSVTGATIANSKTQYATPADVTNPYNCWMVVHDEHYASYYLYNIGAKKFLNLNATNKLSNEPQPLSVGKNGKGYRFITTNKVLGVDATNDQSITTSVTNTDNTTFYLYDNYHFAQPKELSDSLQSVTEPIDKLSLYKANINSMLNAPVGVVGGFTSEEAREALRTAYQDADSNPQAFIEAVENADIIEFDPLHTIYRLKTTNDNATPYMAVDASPRVMGKTSNSGLEQMWRFQPVAGGYSIHSQGLALKNMADESGKNVSLTSLNLGMGKFVISQNEWGKNFISNGQHSSIVVGCEGTSIKTLNSTAQGATWYLEPATTHQLSLNSAGVTTFYADIAITIPDGLKAYVANHVTPDGVIKLTEITGIIPARTPVLLRGESYGKFTANIVNTPDTITAANIFKGTFFRNNSLPKGSILTLATSNGNPVMKKPVLSTVNANQIYLPLESAMPDLALYTFDFDNIIDHVNGVMQVPNSANSNTYNLNGALTPTTVKGHIYIKNHRKVIATE